ncbi:hypothetical protein BC937DRAFT_93014 [Endogone sp. FLAS-F59071]|nr:hypothetical protein BC937DRAFT_93014 [Endogone sp. FLAS-F59071]|eukprot:RUS21331.1 hypothetical protein BC937DRAFT_93014 [Endogone sp. FLAS-F59071]
MSSSTPSTPGSDGTASLSGRQSSVTSTHSSSQTTTATPFPQPSPIHGSVGSLVNASVTVVPADGARPLSIYLFGGFEQYSYEVFDELYRLDMEQNKWQNVIYTKGIRPSKRNDHSTSLWRDKLIIFGGNDDAERHCNDIVLLDLKTLTWSRPEIRGVLPTGRVKHSASVHDNKLYIAGGCTADGFITSDMNVLDLNTWEWQAPISFETRHSHVSCVFQNRLYLYGGYMNEEMDRASHISFIDLNNPLVVTSIEIKSDVSPSPAGQHFAQLCGHHLVVVITHCLKHGVQEASSGIWSLDLRSMQWRQHEGPARFETGSWHYFAMAEHDRRFYLFGTDDPEPDEYLSSVLAVDLDEHGILTVPEPRLGADFAAMLDSDLGLRYADFAILSADSTAPPIRVHRFLLLARWPHFASLSSSGMTESRESRLVIPEPYPVVRAFVAYLYTDSIAGLPMGVVADLLVLANMYLMPRLSALCCDALHRAMDVENVSTIYHQAGVAGELGLKQKALKFMFVHYGPVSKTQGFRGLPKEALLDFWDHTPRNAVIVAAPEEGGGVEAVGL